MDIVTYIFYNMVKLFAILSSKTNSFVMYLDLYGVIFLYIISITSFLFFETYKMRFFILLLMSFVLLSQISLLKTYFIQQIYKNSLNIVVFTNSITLKKFNFFNNGQIGYESFRSIIFISFQNEIFSVKNTVCIIYQPITQINMF